MSSPNEKSTTLSFAVVLSVDHVNSEASQVVDAEDQEDMVLECLRGCRQQQRPLHRQPGVGAAACPLVLGVCDPPIGNKQSTTTLSRLWAACVVDEQSRAT